VLNPVDMPPMTFAVATHGSRAVLDHNFLASPCLEPNHHQLLVKENFQSATRAYNEAIEEAVNDLVALVHHDVILPASWLSDLYKAIDYLSHVDPKWGVLGCFGKTASDRGVGFIYQNGRGLLGEPLSHAMPVQTLDEIVLVIRKSSGIRFDSKLPHFHLYGTDLCLRAMASGLNNYVIPAFCVHNTNFNIILPNEFYESYKHLRRTWRQSLPLFTTCITVSRMNGNYYWMRVNDVRLRWSGRKTLLSPRAQDVTRLLSNSSEALRRCECTLSSPSGGSL
jgi:hypothetical protein